MKMILLVSILAFAAQTFADDMCLGDVEKKQRVVLEARVVKVEKSGSSEEKLRAHQELVQFNCSDASTMKNSQARVKTLSQELGKKAEGKGDLLGAVRWYEGGGLWSESERVMLLAVKKDQLNKDLFKKALALANAHAKQPSGFKSNLYKVAKENADQFMAKENKIISGMGNDMVTSSKAGGEALVLLTEAKNWMEFLPEGSGAVKKRAEARGDMFAARGDKISSGPMAVEFYHLADSPKAEKQKQAMNEMSKKMEKSFESLQMKEAGSDGAFTKKDDAGKKKFKKETDDLEKELDF